MSGFRRQGLDEVRGKVLAIPIREKDLINDLLVLPGHDNGVRGSGLLDRNESFAATQTPAGELRNMAKSQRRIPQIGLEFFRHQPPKE